jgi:hypothetical protein
MYIPTGVELVKNADVILRVKAVENATPPLDTRTWTTGVPDSLVKFQILEVIEGDAPSGLTLHGYLNQVDDFNDQKPPYTFFRPGARSGSCFANSYRKGAEYLLFLKKFTISPDLTVNWAALAPVNEQLHSGNDPWLLWVRDR